MSSKPRQLKLLAIYRPILACCGGLVASGLQERYGLIEMEEGVAGKGVQVLGGKMMNSAQSSTPIKTQKPLVKDEVTPELSHLQAVKRIFRYLKGQPKLGLWYPRDSPFDLEAYSDSDSARVNLNKKSTTVNLVKQIHAIVDGKAVVISESSVRSDLLFNDEMAPDGEGRGDSVERAITMDASLVAAQDSDNIAKTHTTTMSIDPISQEISSGDRPRRQEMTLGGADAQTRVLALEQFMIAQDLVIKRLQKKVKRLEKKQRARTPRMKLFKIDTSKKKTLDKEHVSKQMRDESNRTEELNLSDKGSGETEVFDYTTAAKKDVNAVEPVSTTGDAVNAASVIPDASAAGPSTSTAEDIFKDEMTTMVDTLMAIRRTRLRTTSVVIHDAEEEPRRTPPTVQSQDKEKAAEQEAKDADLIEQIKDVQKKIYADAFLAERLQQEEREQFTVDEQAKMLVDLIEERKRFFVAQRTKQIRNKPPTKAQLRNKMVTYLKHMGKYIHNQLNSKSFKEIQMLYEREQKCINDFVPMDSEEVDDSKQQAEGSKKRSRVDHDKESVKK
uniref:Uncharacterized mitochondrial protein AtMg00810-like n=1 Tax=Tanacetum cinerariifolium TaxID=118510 RepID=A0A699HBR0_TANCI|nr:uncharacterized mitochondrial protein AtMg00810-like [Tanacetum cinerariifolium]